MGWSAGMNSESAVGTSITFTPDTSGEGAYTVSSFTAPKKGVYRFELRGSGGAIGSTETNAQGTFTNGNLPGGNGGLTSGHLLLEKGETVYVGAGGPCSAAFVARAYGASLAAIASASLLFVAGAGGAGGRCERGADYTQYGTGGAGGGASGGCGSTGGTGGTQSAGGSPGGAYGAGTGYSGSYGTGGAWGYAIAPNSSVCAWGGRGGDGYYGGGSGYGVASHNSGTGDTSSYAFGGGGGSGYVKSASLTVNGKTYTSSTSQGGGAGSGANGSVIVTYATRSQLPVFFDRVQLERLFFNGTEVLGLIYNGRTIYIRRTMAWLRKHLTRWRWREASSARRTASLTASV